MLRSNESHDEYAHFSVKERKKERKAVSVQLNSERKRLDLSTFQDLRSLSLSLKKLGLELNPTASLANSPPVLALPPGHIYEQFLGLYLSDCSPGTIATNLWGVFHRFY